ncbi:hypothetical protein C8J57DRAFT_214498 [Mycena rebaudengoi]|nr:hypothetical protein C8J57DRAFT_214498 [Mycena rebaudengoi]
MPKGTVGVKGRAAYASQACNICRAKKIKCNSVKPVCGSCEASGRHDECSWGRETAVRKPRTEAHFEALRKRADALQAYVDRLEGLLAKCVCQDASAHLQFRPNQLGDYASLKDGGDSEGDGASIDSDEAITQELCVPTQSLKLDDKLGDLRGLHGITAPSRFIHAPPNNAARAVDTLERPDASYVLQVDGVNAVEYDPDIDWSRHLPPEVHLKRKEHDKVLDLCFKFFSMFCLRIVPATFLRDMYRALSVPPWQKPPKTPHYSPMLHNALLSIATIFSDEPHIRDLTCRQYFVAAAKDCLEAECQKPDISLVHALSFLATFFGNEGDQIMGDLYYGMSARISQALGLGVDSSAWVKSGNITADEMQSRNWAHWTIFSLDLCWSLWAGRDFTGPPLDRRSIPMPFIDSESDRLPWYHAPAKIPPQPNFLTLSFSASTTLLLIARKIVDVVNGLSSRHQMDAGQDDYRISEIDVELNNWKSQLPPELDITLSNRANSTPQRLMLHCVYWWCFILLHRPFFNRRARAIPTSEPEIDHVKLCKRAADNVMELLDTWSSLYTLRYTPVTLQQVIFSAGTVFLLLSLQATSSLRIAHGLLKTSLSQAELCVHCLSEMGQSWRVAARTCDILRCLLDHKLKPILARRFANNKQLHPEVVHGSWATPQSETSHIPVIHERARGPPIPSDVGYGGHGTEWTISPAPYAPIPANSSTDTGVYHAPFEQSQADMLFLGSPGFESTYQMGGVGGELSPELDAVMGQFLPNFDSFASGPSEQDGYRLTYKYYSDSQPYPGFTTTT